MTHIVGKPTPKTQDVKKKNFFDGKFQLEHVQLNRVLKDLILLNQGICLHCKNDHGYCNHTEQKNHKEQNKLQISDPVKTYNGLKTLSNALKFLQKQNSQILDVEN